MDMLIQKIIKLKEIYITFKFVNYELTIIIKQTFPNKNINGFLHLLNIRVNPILKELKKQNPEISAEYILLRALIVLWFTNYPHFEYNIRMNKDIGNCFQSG